MIAAVSGAALLVVMFIFDWFGGGGGSIDTGLGSVDVPGFGGSAWDTMDLIRFVLLITGVAAVGLAVAKANSQSPNLPVAGSALIAGLGILSTVLVAYRILDTPFDLDRKFGVFLGLIAAAGVAYGGWQSMQEEGTSFGEQADRVQSGGGTGTGTGTGTGPGTGTGTGPGTGTGTGTGTGAPPAV